MLVTATAPIRICDCGGWTDTWFARHGRVLNIAVQPRAQVQVRTTPREPDRPPVLIHAANFGDRYAPERRGGGWDRHPLLEAAVAHVPLPESLSVEITIACDVPPGASTGTSAAVTVALLCALDRARDGSMTPLEIAGAAHAVETERLGQQSGIQDQICSALGGINDIRMTEYPRAEVRQLAVPQQVRWELERRLALVFLGRGHSSSDVHRQVISRLEAEGGGSPSLEALRRTAEAAIGALGAGDLEALGRAMRDNTDAQAALHPGLVCPDATRVMAIAREHGALGWKVNGAGGDGGSLTLLGPTSIAAQRAMLLAVSAASPAFRLIPIALDGDGVRIWATEG